MQLAKVRFLAAIQSRKLTAAVAWQLAKRRSHHSHRLAVAGSTRDEIAARLREVARVRAGPQEVVHLLTPYRRGIRLVQAPSVGG